MRGEKASDKLKCFLTVFDCGFSSELLRGLQWRYTQNQTCDLPVSPNTNPPCRPDCVCVSVWACVWPPSITYTPPPCSLSSTSVYIPAVSTPPRRHGNARHSTSASTGLLQPVVREKVSENILKPYPTVRRECAFDVEGASRRFVLLQVLKRANNEKYCLFIPQKSSFTTMVWSRSLTMSDGCFIG